MFKLRRLLLAALIAAPLAAQAADVVNLFGSVEINAPADKVWAMIRNFDGLNTWHPAFSADVLKSGTNNEVGAVRTLTLAGGPSFDEELLAFSDTSRTLRYRIVGAAPLPLSGYVSWISVYPYNKGTSTVAWSGRFVPDNPADGAELGKALNGLYKAGLDNLKKLAE